MSSDGNSEFKGSTVARLDRIEADIKEVKGDVRIVRDQVVGWKAQLAIFGVALPIIVSVAIRMIFP